MNAFIVTLASYIWVRGLVVAVSGGRSAQDLPPALRFIGIETFLAVPLIAWMAIICFAVFSFVMVKTPFGRHVTMIGGNSIATYRAGINVGRITVITFIMAGTVSGLAGWMLAIRTSGATANLGAGMLFQAFAAVVIGGLFTGHLAAIERVGQAAGQSHPGVGREFQLESFSGARPLGQCFCLAGRLHGCSPGIDCGGHQPGRPGRGGSGGRVLPERSERGGVKSHAWGEDIM